MRIADGKQGPKNQNKIVDISIDFKDYNQQTSSSAEPNQF